MILFSKLDADRYRKMAKESILDGLDKPELATIQCLILLSIYEGMAFDANELYQLHGLSVQAAYQLGLHLPETYQHLSYADAEIRRRIWSCCFIRNFNLVYCR